MAKKPYFNPGPSAMFVGGVMIPPNDSRDVDEQFLPTVDAPEAAVDEPPDPDANYREILAGTIAEILPTLADASDETLDALERLEQGHASPRKGLLGPIAELKLKRAQARAGGGPT
jgi:hypothetical protein